MDRQLRRLETHRLHGSDGRTYLVHGYEHQVREADTGDPTQGWQPTGTYEYKLADGTHVAVDHTGAMSIPGSGIRLERTEARPR
jgi:hypothetical protein